jgi:pyruvate,water dikinase
MPMAQSLTMQRLYPDGFNRGFTETFARYGLLLDRLAMASINGFTYHQPQPFDMPGPDGPMSDAEIGAEIGRREALAAETFATKRWRADLDDWDTNWKPQAIARHVELGSVALADLDDVELAAHLDEVGAHVEAMVYQHHRFNMAAIMPVGDMALQLAEMFHAPPHEFLSLLDGYSPVSNVRSDESADAVDAIASDDDAVALVRGDGPAADRLAALRDLLPAVDAYVRMVQDRTIDGFDIVNPTLREQPELILGRLDGALDADPDATRRRADEAAAELRGRLSADDAARFDELVAEARAVYRLRDERGLYSDVTAVGLMRRAALEVGARCAARGTLHRAADALDADPAELAALLTGTGPNADELADRAAQRAALTAEGAPRFLGPPPPEPPPADQLPPALGRIMGATGYMIESILGQLDDVAGDEHTVVGIGVNDQTVEGPARLIGGLDDLLMIEPGDIIVPSATGESFNSVLHLVAGIVTDHGSHACHAAIVAREMGFPAVVGSINATERIADGARVRVNGASGEVTILT